jgi:hypothetical protein
VTGLAATATRRPTATAFQQLIEAFQAPQAESTAKTRKRRPRLPLTADALSYPARARSNSTLQGLGRAAAARRLRPADEADEVVDTARPGVQVPLWQALLC